MLIVIKRTGDLPVAIMRLVPGHDADAEIAKWIEAHPGEYVSHREMDVPEDRTFRNAWRDETEAPVIDVDMPTARNIWRDTIRAARKPMLEQMDIEYRRAADKAAVEAHAQKLRDATRHPDIEAAETPEDLKKVWPLKVEDDPPQQAGFSLPEELILDVPAEPEPVEEPMPLPPNPVEAKLSDYGEVGEPEVPAEPEPLDLNEVPDVLKRFVEADESPAEFRIRLKKLWQRFGIEDGKHFPGGGEALSGDEKILMGDLMAVMNAHTFAWMRPSE
jgi:hypothetical protein